MALRYHLIRKLRWPGVRYRLMAHRDHRLMYFEDQTLMGEILEVLERPWYRRLVRWPWFGWEIESNDSEVAYYYWAPDALIGEEIRRKIIGKHPDVDISRVDTEIDWSDCGFVTASSMKLERDYPVPIKSFFNEVVDTQAPIVNAISDLGAGERCLVQILVQPARRYQRDFDKAIKIVKRWDIEDEHEKIELFETNISGKQNKQLGHCVIRIMAGSKTNTDANRIRSEVARSFGQFTSEALNSFKPREKWTHVKPVLLRQIRNRIFPVRERRLRRMILNIEEMSGVIRLPSAEVNNTRLTRLYLKQMEAPAGVVRMALDAKKSVGANHFLRLGENHFRMRVTAVYVNMNFLNRHMIVTGGSGVGKTVFLVDMMKKFVEQKLAGNSMGFFLIDPLGGLASELMSNIPRELWDQVNYVRPDPHAKVHFPMNVFDVDFSTTEHSISHNIGEAVGRIWPEGWGPRPEQNFLLVGMALQRLGEASVINLERCLRDVNYTMSVAERINKYHPDLAEKGVGDFLGKLIAGGTEKATPANKRSRNELIDSTLNKLVHFTMSSVLAPAFGAKTCGFRWKESMDKGLINILDLSRVQDDGEKRMLGSLALTMNYQASQARLSTAANSLYPIIADEFPMFIQANAKVINEMADRTRQKYVPIIGAAQGIITQLDREVADAIGRNFATQVVFRMNHKDDCEWLEGQFNDPRLKYSDIMQTPPNYAYARIGLERESSLPFTLLVDPPSYKKADESILDEIAAMTIARALKREEAATAKVVEEPEEIGMDYTEIINNLGQNTDIDSETKDPDSIENASSEGVDDLILLDKDERDQDEIQTQSEAEDILSEEEESDVPEDSVQAEVQADEEPAEEVLTENTVPKKVSIDLDDLGDLDVELNVTAIGSDNPTPKKEDAGKGKDNRNGWTF